MAEPLQVRAGQGFDISLPGTPTAGYRWEVTIPPEASGVVNLLGSNWTPVTSHVGGTAKQQFHFRALAPGRVALHFRYGRPWEPVASEEREVAITVMDA